MTCNCIMKGTKLIYLKKKPETFKRVNAIIRKWLVWEMLFPFCFSGTYCSIWHMRFIFNIAYYKRKSIIS